MKYVYFKYECILNGDNYFSRKKKKEEDKLHLAKSRCSPLSRVTIQRPITWSVEFLVLTETV